MEQFILAVALICQTQSSANYHSYAGTQQQEQKECAAKILNCYADSETRNRYKAAAECLRK